MQLRTTIHQLYTRTASLAGKMRQLPYIRAVRRQHLSRGYAAAMLLLFITSTGTAVLQPFFQAEPYAIDSAARAVLPKPNPRLAEALKHDMKTAAYKYNEGYTGSDISSQGSPRIQATIGTDPKTGIEVTDTTNNLTFALKPKFGLGMGRKESNQVMYPLTSQRGYLVYTAQVSGVKEDILLAGYTDDVMEFTYELQVPDGLEARLESNGSIGVYGSTLPIYGQVSTGTEKDKELLAKAKQKAAKDKLLFTLPAPVVIESNKTVSQVLSHFELNGTELKVVAKNLHGASFPLSIDPSVYVETAQKLMRGNNETNVDFETTNELIQKGELTGGRFDNWVNTLTLPNARNQHASVAAGGYVYYIGGKQGNTRVSTVYWAKLNTSTKIIEAANPGNGACTNWCTSTAYDLPVATSGHSLVAYNGFLYVIGGETGSGRTNAVYISKLGMNGEPSLWHPTDTNQANWVFWYQAGNLSTERAFTSAVAYNNRMYLVGGQTNSGTNAGGVTTVEKAEINPTGDLGSWSTTGMVALTNVRRSHNIHIYNDRMYILGGVSNVTPQSTVQYIRIASDGTMSGSWISATSMSTARFSDGGNFSIIMNGYIYIAGGCAAVTGAGNWCSVAGLSTANIIALSSINADGSLTVWDTITGLTQARTGYGFVAWRKTIYGLGGCTAPNDTTGACTTDSSVVNYGAVNRDGDVSTTDNSVPTGTAPCSGGAPTNCDIPPAGDSAAQGGRMASGVVMNNGYIYIIGGCTSVALTDECYGGGNNGAMSGNISYSAFAADGTLVAPATCVGSFYGNWCVDATNRLNGTDGIGATGATIFNNTIYAVSGTDGARWKESIYRVGLNADGSLTGAWTAQTFNSVGLGGIGRGFMFVFARANPASAGTNPGNLYIMGGCNGGTERSDGVSCNTFFNAVYKCSIGTSGAITGSSCTTTGQLQIDAETGTGGDQGLSNMAGVVYANYIYLVGGSSPNFSARGEVMYAKIDNSNNIVAVSGSTWITSANSISPARQRGAAFGYNGYLYSLAGYSGSGSLNDVLYAKIDVSDGSISAWTTSLVTVTPRWQLGAIVANGFVYAFGGCGTGAAPSSCTAMTGSIQTFQLYNNYSGSPAGYSTGNTIGVDRIGGSSVVMDGYIYYVGGCSNIGCTTATNTAYYAPLNADGTIGTWTLGGNTLPGNRVWGKLLAQGGTLYYIGGQDSAGTAQSTVYYSVPSSGVPGTWSATTNPLPAARSELSGAIWDGRLFITGGHTGGTRQASVYASPELPSGGDITGSWVTTNDFNVARSGHATFVYSNNLYVVGGSDGTNYLSDMQFAKLDPATGAATGWTYSASLPQKVYQADAYAANGYLYVFGGRSATTTCTNNTYVTPISANTTIASGNNPTGIGDWSQTNVEFTEARYGAAVAYDQGKAYVLGGGCTSFVASGNRTYVSTLQSQPATARYSRMIDTDTDVFPTKWLMNGLDNDVGARWTMRYRSSTDATAAWGQETSFGTVTLGNPENYIPLDGSGANTNFARFYWMSTYIDSSKAFGYPDDVSRGPTIDDITLFFTADPSKRLKHGKTFTQGQLQPLDTPF